ncbi:MAG TPA: TIGR00730 family Rossman fold protein [Actinomycetota bacterium]
MPRRPPRLTGDETLDDALIAFLDELDPIDRRIALETLGTALTMARGNVARLDRKIVNTALKEMRQAFSVFAPLRSRLKVTLFGSARTAKHDPTYATARELAAQMAAKDWMVVTGAGPGIMEAGHEGAGGDHSIGVNIQLPFEAEPNPFIAADPKLINFKYFFTRKLIFIKESDAFVLLPGGFGTMDEAFELLTLIQTGKSDLHPIIMLDAPGGSFWRTWEETFIGMLIKNGMIDHEDRSFFHVTDDVADAVAQIERFYRVYHSGRYVEGRLVLRLKRVPPRALLERLSEEFADILDGPIESVEATEAERRDDDVPDLPRIALRFDRTHTGRLRALLDRVNDEG